MEEKFELVRLQAARLAGVVFALVLTFLWSTTAYAQSREDQYGSPTDAVDHANRASEALSVLPDTGGPLILLVGAALVVAGTGMTLVGRRIGRR